MKQYLFFILVLLSFSVIISGQQTSVVLSSTLNGTQNVVAKQAVFLKPGFQYTAVNGHSFNASINPNLQLPVYLTGNQIVNANTRDLNTSLPVGSLPGSINVNDYGAAVYEVPLFIPPGTAGMQPGISVVYNSLIGDGVLGKGWDIAGLSSIERVAQNFYNDGKAIGVKLQYTDRFALDSNRLVCITGTYGQDGSIYSTELETFVKVTAYGSAGNGPQWFKVETKDGKTLEYGNTNDSRVEAYGSSTVFKWRINRIKDVNGNYIDFTYNENSGESSISTINYTGNLTSGAPFSSPYNSINFIYSSRTDLNSHFVGGSKIPKNALLTEIQMMSENSLVRKYHFNYNMDFYTHLNEIIEYGSDGIYFNSTAIGWGKGTPEEKYDWGAGGLGASGVTNNYYMGDFNGDGRTDFILTPKKTTYSTSDQWVLYLGSNSPFAYIHYTNTGQLSSGFKGFQVTDVDGDGVDEIFWRERETVTYLYNPHLCEGGNQSVAQKVENTDQLVLPPPQDTCWDVGSYQQEAFRVYNFNGTTIVRGNTAYDQIFTGTDLDITLVPADFDGNGKNEYVVLNNNKNAVTTRGLSSYGSLSDFNSPDDVRFLDFDGDGKKDILVIKGNSSNIYQIDPINMQWTSIYSSSTYPTSTHRIYLGDFNGDKKTDVLSWNSAWAIRFSSGTGFVTSTNTPSLRSYDPEASMSDNNYFVADYNGDRKDDIIEAYLNGGQSNINVFYSQGEGLFVNENNSYSVSNINQFYFQPSDINGDGKKELSYSNYSVAENGISFRFFHKDEIQHNVSIITNGLNFKTQICYERLNNDTAFYKKANGANFPVYDFSGSYYAVSKIITPTSDYVGTINQVYYYEGAHFHRQGKGFLGFSKLSQSDDSRSIENIKSFEYNTTYYFLYLKEVLSRTAAPYRWDISIVTYSNSIKEFGNQRIFPFSEQITNLDKQGNKEIVTDYVYDNWGNALRIKNSYITYSSSSLDAVKISNLTYQAIANYGIANKVSSRIDSSTYTSQPLYVRKSEYTYNSEGNLITEVIDPGKSFAVTKTYSSYNVYGLPAQITLSATSLTSRSTQYEYDNKYRFVTKATNPIDHFVSRVYNSGTGNIISETGIDGKITSYEYDSFGRLTKENSPLGFSKQTEISWNLGVNNVFKITSTMPDNPEISTYYDIYNREVGTRITGQFGYIYSEKEYNPGGTLKRASKPHYDGGTVNWINYSYDKFGRVDTINDNNIKTLYQYGYEGTTVTRKGETGGKDQSKLTRTNSLGNVIHVEDIADSLSIAINYTYHSSGQPKTITTSGSTITFNYDDYGRQTSCVNPNSGTTTSGYNAYGELISQTDANGNTYSFQYDNLSRNTSKTGPDGTTNYSYVTTGNGIEQLQGVTGANSISQSYTYDSFGRVTQINETIPGDQSFTTSYGYNTYGNITSVTYPSGLVINQLYTNGYLSEIKKSDGTSIWKIDGSTSLGQPTQYTLGSSNPGIKTYFTYDSFGYLATKKTGKASNEWEQTYNFEPYNGNLMNRSYKLTGTQTELTEPFTYDNYNRLISYGLNGGESVSYSDNGNITAKGDAGVYEYDPAKLNAVSSIRGNQGTIPEGQQTIEYTKSNMTSSVEEGTKRLELTYGPGNQRIKSVLKSNNAVIKTKYYSGLYEKEVTTSTRELNYITCPSGIFAVIVKQGSTESLYYTETDHLGSTIGLINSTDGSFTERSSFDAWGRRRNPANWSYNNVPQNSILERGFTGHEQVDQFGLINMNGRMYDPVLGRFAGVDPFIQSPESSQSYNGYTYCLNNPLKYIDPSGYVAFKNLDEFWDIVNDLWNSPDGGSWDSGSGITYYPEGYVVSAGSGFRGPNLPYMLGEVTVAAKAPEKHNQTKGKGSPWYYGIPGVGPALESGNHLNNGNYWAAASTFLMALVDVFTLGEASGGTAFARSLGKAGEDAVGIVGSKVRIPSLTSTASYRIPDRLTATTLEEVKNVQSLSLTRQLMDFNLFSQQTGRQFIIYTNATQISGPLRNLESQGLLIFYKIP